MDFAVLMDHKVKLNEDKRMSKYFDIVKEPKKNPIKLRKLGNFEVTVIPVVDGAIETVPLDSYLSQGY